MPNDIILITGKGHETYQDYGKKILNISDFKILDKIKLNKTKILIERSNKYNPKNDPIKLTGRATAGTITALRLPRNR